MDDSRLKEKLEVLDGTRSRASIDEAAVRIRDLVPLLQMPAELSSTNAAGAPTQAEFNALVDDVQLIHGRLKAIVDILKARRNL